MLSHHQEMKSQGIVESRLQLLQDVSGAFRPGVLTALVGVSGAGKTTLMDVLSGRKTGGYIEGSISISGYPKNQATFARVSGYCEQNDIHSPYVTVYESLLYSAWLRLASDVKKETRKVLFDDGCMDKFILLVVTKLQLFLPRTYLTIDIKFMMMFELCLCNIVLHKNFHLSYRCSLKKSWN